MNRHLLHGRPLSLPVLYALLGGAACVGGGLALLAVAMRGLPAKPEHEKAKPASARRTGPVRRPARLARRRRRPRRAASLTRWAVAGVAAGMLVFFWDRLFGGAAEERAAMRRVEALAAWTESLRDTIAGAVGLEQAIPASARAAAPVLRPHLRRAGRPAALPYAAARGAPASSPTRSTTPPPTSSSPRSSSTRELRGPGLRQVLGALAKSAREEVDMRQRVMAQRSPAPGAACRSSSWCRVAFVLGLAVFNRDFVEPYGTAVGQVVLAVCVRPVRARLLVAAQAVDHRDARSASWSVTSEPVDVRSRRAPGRSPGTPGTAVRARGRRDDDLTMPA